MAVWGTSSPLQERWFTDTSLGVNKVFFVVPIFLKDLKVYYQKENKFDTVNNFKTLL